MQLPNNYQPAAHALADKVILVTGAGDGIGRSAAIHFAQQGASVILMGRTLAKLERVYDEIETLGAPEAAIMPLNFETLNDDQCAEIANAIQAMFGRLDGILHNAAELGERTPISNYSTNAWLRCMQVNVNAPFMLTKSLSPLLEQASNASVVFSSSSVARQGRAYWGGYAASKAAQDNLMQTLADEADGISQVRFNSINPGGTRTSMRKKAYPAEDPNTVKAPEALMPYYIYLFSDAAQGVSGNVFNYSAA